MVVSTLLCRNPQITLYVNSLLKSMYCLSKMDAAFWFCYENTHMSDNSELYVGLSMANTSLAQVFQTTCIIETLSNRGQEVRRL